MSENKYNLASRQIHLDFHTSEKIDNVASEFDPTEFAKTLKQASVNSVTVFACCHHGNLYYPSKKYPEYIHPNLERNNLLYEQIEALHKEGIKAPVYITVQYNHHIAKTKPEWLMRRRDGSFYGGYFDQPGFYQALCVNTGYYKFLEDITLEVMDTLKDNLDGLFYDIVFARPCYCAACRKEMEKQGIDISDEKQVALFGKQVLDNFKMKLSSVIRKKNKNCTIFYNAGHIGPYVKNSAEAYSHFELESLPSGWWGYLHFPTTARYARTLGKACLGMTGKFHTEWGDFHSLKNQAALEFECFKMASYGFGVSIGDQLEPYGKLNKDTYKLVGNVYRQLELVEDWYLHSNALVEAALVTPEGNEAEVPENIFGAAQMLEELSIQFDIIDRDMKLDKYPLVILPENLVIDEKYEEKLKHYVEKGGKIISICNGGMRDGNYPEFFGVKHNGYSEGCDFVIANQVIGKALAQNNEYVIMEGSSRIEPKDNSEVIMEASMPYFYRKDTWFCSHLYTPSAKKEKRPAVIQHGNIITISPKLFFHYRKKAPVWCKEIFKDCFLRLKSKRILSHNGPSTVQLSILEQEENSRYNIHVLNYVPVRKSTDIDIIEDIIPLYNLKITFNTPRKILKATLVPENIPLKISKDNEIVIERMDGHCIIQLDYC